MVEQLGHCLFVTLFPNVYHLFLTFVLFTSSGRLTLDALYYIAAVYLRSYYLSKTSRTVSIDTYKPILNIANIKLRDWNELVGASNIANIRFRAWVRIMDMIRPIRHRLGKTSSMRGMIIASLRSELCT